MTMKYLDKNVSAEFDETVITDANLNNGILTFTCKDFYRNEIADNITVDLKDIKLRIYKLKENETLNDYKNTQDADKILKRETHLFLVPVENQNDTHNTEGIYHEYIWIEDEDDFEMLGSTYLNLEPINTNIATLQSKVSSNESVITTLQGKVSSNESNITTLQGKVSSNESNINSLITANTSIVNAIRENANDISNLTSSKQGVNDTGLETNSKTIVGAINEINSKSVETVDSVTNGESKPVTSNAVYDELNNYVKKQTGKGLSQNDFTDDYKDKLDTIKWISMTDFEMLDKYDSELNNPEPYNTYSENPTKETFLSIFAPNDNSLEEIIADFIETFYRIGDSIVFFQFYAETWNEFKRLYIYQQDDDIVNTGCGVYTILEDNVIETVDTVSDGETKPVTSNAVYDAIQNINTDLPSELDFSNFLVIYEDGTSEQISLYEKNNSE